MRFMLQSEISECGCVYCVKIGKSVMVGSRSSKNSSQSRKRVEEVDDDVLELSDDELALERSRKYSCTERRQHLRHLLSLNTCSRSVIFERLKDYYNVSEE